MSLSWADERYVRLYTRDTPSWLLGPWEARAVLAPVFRKLDRAGTLPLGADGLEALAVIVGLPLAVVEPGMAWWLKRGTFELVEGVLVAPNFIDAQEAKASDRKRAAEHRERTRDQARAGTLPSRTVTDRHADSGQPGGTTIDPLESSQGHTPTLRRSVTKRDEVITHRDPASRTVTDRHAESTSVTPSRAVPSLAVPPEEREAPAAPPLAPKPKVERSKKQKSYVPPSDAAPADVEAWCTMWAIPSPTSNVEAAKMVDHFRASGGTKADWGATWRNWDRRSGDFGQRSGRDPAIGSKDLGFEIGEGRRTPTPAGPVRVLDTPADIARRQAQRDARDADYKREAVPAPVGDLAAALAPKLSRPAPSSKPAPATPTPPSRVELSAEDLERRRVEGLEGLRRLEGAT